MTQILRDLLSLTVLDGGRDAALLALRIATGVFIVDGVWDNIVDKVRMAEFIGFLDTNGFPSPAFWAPFSVWTQFLAGALLISGLATRWAGLILVATFIVGIFMIHWTQSLREMWPALALVVIGAVAATYGGGRFSLDAVVRRRNDSDLK